MPFWRRRHENNADLSGEPQGLEWTPPDYAEVVVVTFILELPQDLRHPPDKAFVLTAGRADLRRNPAPPGAPKC